MGEASGEFGKAAERNWHLWEVYGGITQDLQAGIQARNWNQILEQGDSTWVWVTGVFSQNTAEYSSLTCDQMTNVPAGHKCSLIHFPQWAVLTLLFSLWVMTCKRLGITAYKELRKRCFCCSAILRSHFLLPHSSFTMIFFYSSILMQNLTLNSSKIYTFWISVTKREEGFHFQYQILVKNCDWSSLSQQSTPGPINSGQKGVSCIQIVAPRVTIWQDWRDRC